MRISQHNNIANLDIWKYNGHPRNLNHSMRKQYKKIKVWYRTKHLKSLQTIIATERKHKHKAPDKTCFKHISNQKSWMQTIWFWWLIKLKRILLFSDLSWSNWKEFSYLVDVSWWSPSTSQLIISFNLLGKAWTGSWLGLEYAWLVKGLVTEALNTPFLVNCELGELASSWASSPSKW